MIYDSPYQRLYCNSDSPEEQAKRQAEADRINATTDRTIEVTELIRDFEKLLKREGIGS